MTKIYVGNLLYEVTEQDLHDLFQQFGEVTSAEIVRYKKSGRSKGFGFVTMTDDNAASTAMAQLNEYDYRGRKLMVGKAKDPKPEGTDTPATPVPSAIPEPAPVQETPVYTPQVEESMYDPQINQDVTNPSYEPPMPSIEQPVVQDDTNQQGVSQQGQQEQYMQNEEVEQSQRNEQAQQNEIAMEAEQGVEEAKENVFDHMQKYGTIFRKKDN